MNWNLVRAVIYRHMYNFKHSYDRATDVFYWPLMDILLWGFASVYLANQSSDTPLVLLIILSGLMLNMVMWRAQYDITVNLLEEMWAKNMINMFASPLRLREWIVAVIILGTIKMCMTLSMSVILALIIYKTNLFDLGFYLIPFFASLLMTGWGIGLFISGIIVYFGTKIQTLAWSGISVITPFSGVFYPISVLPDWAQKVSAFLPTSYIFEGMRAVVTTHSLPLDMLAKSIILNIILIAIGLCFFIFMFGKSCEKGLARLE